MIPGDFQFYKPPKNKLILFGVIGFIGFVIFIGIALLATFHISSWIDKPVIFAAEAPDQPIAFPHTVHVQELGLDCTFCHTNVTKGASASIPAVNLCMSCHTQLGDGSTEIEKLRDIHAKQDVIQWTRVHRMPDHVRFIHEAHVKRFSGSRQVVETITDSSNQIRIIEAKVINPNAKIGETLDIAASGTCSICHGDVSKMHKVEQVRTLKMSDCVDCHRENNGPTDCTTCHY
ncbi:MAG: cytochrome c3 family protein [Dehalococcoidia bacterium]